VIGPGRPCSPQPVPRLPTPDQGIDRRDRRNPSERRRHHPHGLGRDRSAGQSGAHSRRADPSLPSQYRAIPPSASQFAVEPLRNQDDTHVIYVAGGVRPVTPLSGEPGADADSCTSLTSGQDGRCTGPRLHCSNALSIWFEHPQHGACTPSCTPFIPLIQRDLPAAPPALPSLSVGHLWLPHPTRTS